MTMTSATTGQTFYRTAKGSHRHAQWTCANFRRSIQLGGVIVIPATEVAAWAPCDACCGTEDVTVHAGKEQAKADAMCRNSGVQNPRRIQSECKDCGKRGAVNRSTGSLRAHKPMSV